MAQEQTLGDKVEITALVNLLETSDSDSTCYLGSVKANIGHTKAAAGMAGLFKAVLALQRNIIPPTVNCQHPNPAFGSLKKRLRPSLTGQKWAIDSKPRRAGVSAFGFGGSNTHITLEEASRDDTVFQEDLAVLNSHQNSELILIEGDTEYDLQLSLNQLISIVEKISRAELIDLSAALSKALDNRGKLRLAFITDSPWNLMELLQQVSYQLNEGIDLSNIHDPHSGIFAGKILENPRLGVLCPGQGIQRLNMGQQFWQRYPFIKDFYQKAEQETLNFIPNGLHDSIFHDLWIADDPMKQDWEVYLQETHVAQPAIVTTSIATLKVLEHLQLQPDIAIGHSLGEITALYAGGAIDDTMAVRLAGLRGQAIATLNLADKGAMLAIKADPTTVESLLQPFATALTISNYNTPHQTVVAGRSEAVEAVQLQCQKQEIPCRKLSVSHAFHTSMVAPASSKFHANLQSSWFHPLVKTVISTVTGKVLNEESDLKEIVTAGISQPVRFVEAVLAANAQYNPSLWIEVGPGSVLTNLLSEILPEKKLISLPTDLEEEENFDLLNRILAQAYILGFPIAVDKLFANRFHRPIPLDNYNPKLIINPCERPVPIPDIAPFPSHEMFTPNLFPQDASSSEISTYLAKRSQFLNELISLDYKHFIKEKNPTALENLEVPNITKPVDSQETEHTSIKETITHYAINWIAKRTGFSKQSIGLDMKLRDDLNIDSIKAGELFIDITEKFEVNLTQDPSEFANASLQVLIDMLCESLSSENGLLSTNPEANIPQISLIPGLKPWVRILQLESVTAPLTMESKSPLPD